MTLSKSSTDRLKIIQLLASRVALEESQRTDEHIYTAVERYRFLTSNLIMLRESEKDCIKRYAAYVKPQKAKSPNPFLTAHEILLCSQWLCRQDDSLAHSVGKRLAQLDNAKLFAIFADMGF